MTAGSVLIELGGTGACPERSRSIFARERRTIRLILFDRRSFREQRLVLGKILENRSMRFLGLPFLLPGRSHRLRDPAILRDRLSRQNDRLISGRGPVLFALWFRLNRRGMRKARLGATITPSTAS